MYKNIHPIVLAAIKIRHTKVDFCTATMRRNRSRTSGINIRECPLLELTDINPRDLMSVFGSKWNCGFCFLFVSMGSALRLASQFRSMMTRAVLASTLAATLLAGGAVAQIPPTDRRMPPPRSIQLSAQQGYVIKENLKDMHIGQVPRTKEIGIGNKVPSDIGLHDFPPLVVEKVPKLKPYKFFITENQIVLVSPQKEIADIIK